MRSVGRHTGATAGLLGALGLLCGAPAAAADPSAAAAGPDPTQATSPDPTAATQPADAVPVYDVYVTSERDVVTSIVTRRDVTREDMRQEGARNLDEALVHEPSIIVRTGGEGSPRIDIRGLRTRQILTLIDGVPFYSTEDGAFDPSLIPTQIIERVDIIYSNSSVLYGDGPIAGIVQIHTRSGEPGLHADARGDVRTGNQYLGQASVSGAGEGLQGFAAGRYFDRSGWDLPDSFDAKPLEGGGRRNNSDRKQGNAFTKVGYVISEEARVDALADYWHAEYGVPWRVEQQTDYVGRARFERVDEAEGFTTQLSGQLEAGERVSLRSWAFATRQVEDRSSYDDRNLDTQDARNTFDLEGTTLITGGAIHGRVDGGALGALRMAVNGRYEQFESDGTIRDVPLGGGVFGLRGVDERDSIGAWSIGAEYELKPVEYAGLVLGYGHAFLDGDRSVSDDGSLFLGGAYVDLPTGTRLRASAARKLRFPSLRQLYAVDGGNRDLDPERCWCFEVGVSQALPFDTTLGVTGFWLELDDFIERDDTTDLFENRQELESRGVEIVLLSNPWKPLLLRASYTFLDARDKSSGSPFDRLDNRPRHKLDAEARLRLPTRTEVRFAVTWLQDNLIYTRNAPYLSTRLDDFALVDMRVEQPFLGDHVSLYFGIDNLTDEESEINVAFPQEGRTYYGGITLRY